MQDFRQFDEAWGRIDEATTTLEKTKERWSEVEIHRATGGIFWIQTRPEKHRGVAGYVQKEFIAPTVACDCRLAVNPDHEAHNPKLRAIISFDAEARSRRGGGAWR